MKVRGTLLNLRPLLSQLTIIGKDLVTKKLNINDEDEYGWCQGGLVDEVERQYNAGKPVRIIVLKARQLGISTVTEGILFNWTFIHPGTNALVATHENEASANLFEKTKLYWNTWPFRKFYKTKYHTRREIHFLETGSSIKVTSAKNLQKGRSFTFHAVHLSEFAFYPDPDTLLTGLNQTVPNKHGTVVIIESTANGQGNLFHQMWKDAVNGDIDYVPLFFPWWYHSDYRSHTTLHSLDQLEPEELSYFKLFTETGYTDSQGNTITITRPEAYQAIEWRRWAIPNLANSDEDKFMQEYPATPEEAFIATGHPVFSPLALRQCYAHKVGQRGHLIEDVGGKYRFVEDRSGNLTIFKNPRRDARTDRYFIGADPSRILEGDPSCMQVINRGTFEQVAVWHGQIEPISFGREMMKVGYFFNTAMLCPEVNGSGMGTIGYILSQNYPSVWQHRWADRLPGKLGSAYGWATNWERKMQAIGFLKSLILDRSLKIHDALTFSQLEDYAFLGQDFGNATSGKHDDAVMALAIAIAASIAEGPFIESTGTHNPIFDIFTQESLNTNSYAEVSGQ